VGCRRKLGAKRKDCKVAFIWFYNNPSVVI